MHVALRQIGNSLGVVIPKSFLTETGLTVETGVDLSLEGAAIVLRKPSEPPRQGWGEAAQALIAAGEGALALRLDTLQDDLTW